MEKTGKNALRDSANWLTALWCWLSRNWRSHSLVYFSSLWHGSQNRTILKRAGLDVGLQTFLGVDSNAIMEIWANYDKYGLLAWKPQNVAVGWISRL